jgi:hypothetical protein
MTQLSEIPWDYIRRQITTVVADFIQPSSLLSSLRSAFADRKPGYAPEQCLIQGSPTATRQHLTLNPENKTAYTQKASEAPQEDTNMEDPNVTPANNADKQQPVQNTVPTEQNIAAEKAAQATQQDITLQPQMQNMQWQPRDTTQVHLPSAQQQAAQGNSDEPPNLPVQAQGGGHGGARTTACDDSSPHLPLAPEQATTPAARAPRAP